MRASDIDPIAAAATRLNAELNGADIEVAETGLVGWIEDDWDLVRVGDIDYSEALGRRATGWLQALAARGTEVPIADNDRLDFPRDAFEAWAPWPSSPITRFPTRKRAASGSGAPSPPDATAPGPPTCSADTGGRTALRPKMLAGAGIDRRPGPRIPRDRMQLKRCKYP